MINGTAPSFDHRETSDQTWAKSVQLIGLELLHIECNGKSQAAAISLKLTAHTPLRLLKDSSFMLAPTTQASLRGNAVPGKEYQNCERHKGSRSQAQFTISTVELKSMAKLYEAYRNRHLAVWELPHQLRRGASRPCELQRVAHAQASWRLCHGNGSALRVGR